MSVSSFPSPFHGNLPRSVVTWAAILAALLIWTLSFSSVSAIVGGHEASVGSQPWAVGVALANEPDGYFAQFCGGSLIAARWVLTAAHCTYDEEGYPFRAENLDVLVNRHHLNQQQGERIRVKRIIRHPAFVASTFNADLALLQLESASDSAPLLLASTPNQISSATATVFGWGVSDDGLPVNALHQVSLPLVPREDCGNIYATFDRTINRNMLCAGYLEGGKDACIGDSGGPLTIPHSETGQWMQIGIVSWGEGCGDANTYGVYTDITAFDRWIYVQMLYHSRQRALP